MFERILKSEGKLFIPGETFFVCFPFVVAPYPEVQWCQLSCNVPYMYDYLSSSCWADQVNDLSDRDFVYEAGGHLVLWIINDVASLPDQLYGLAVSL